MAEYHSKAGKASAASLSAAQRVERARKASAARRPPHTVQDCARALLAHYAGRQEATFLRKLVAELDATRGGD